MGCGEERTYLDAPQQQLAADPQALQKQRPAPSPQSPSNLAYQGVGGVVALRTGGSMTVSFKLCSIMYNYAGNSAAKVSLRLFT